MPQIDKLESITRLLLGEIPEINRDGIPAYVDNLPQPQGWMPNKQRNVP
jgi:hypothetical protein